MSERGVLLSDVDNLGLQWIGEQYGVTTEQLRILFGMTAKKKTVEGGKVTLGTVEWRVKRWVGVGLAEREKIHLRRPAWVFLTKEGLGVMELDYDARKPSQLKLNEIEWMNYVKLHVWKRQGENIRDWRSERQLRFEWGREETKKDKHVPDAELDYFHDDRVWSVAIEVELTQKTQARIQKILRELARSYDKVWYFVNHKTEQFIKKQIAKLSAEDREAFVVFVLEQELGYLKK